MNRAHVIRLNPIPEQAAYFRKACGVARHAYVEQEARALSAERVKLSAMKQVLAML